MKTQNKENHTVILILKVIFGFAVGIAIGFLITKSLKYNNRITSSIEKTIQQHCACESVEKNISAIGFQFSKEDGVTNQTASFTLNNCKYNYSAKDEAKRINEYLKVAVGDYQSLDLIELSFISEAENELFKNQEWNHPITQLI